MYTVLHAQNIYINCKHGDTCTFFHGDIVTFKKHLTTRVLLAFYPGLEALFTSSRTTKLGIFPDIHFRLSYMVQ